MITNFKMYESKNTEWTEEEKDEIINCFNRCYSKEDGYEEPRFMKNLCTVIVRDDMSFEPEVGSWNERTLIEVILKKLGTINIECEFLYTSGEYGCDDDEDSGVEPEFDWRMGCNNYEQKEALKDVYFIEEFVDKCMEEIKENY